MFPMASLVATHIHFNVTFRVGTRRVENCGRCRRCWVWLGCQRWTGRVRYWRSVRPWGGSVVMASCPDSKFLSFPLVASLERTYPLRWRGFTGRAKDLDDGWVTLGGGSEDITRNGRGHCPWHGLA